MPATAGSSATSWPPDSSRGPASVRCGRWGPPTRRHAVDVTDSFDAGLASLHEHRAYLAGLGPDAPDPAEMLEGMARQAGTQLGVPMAVSMEVLPLQLL